MGSVIMVRKKHQNPAQLGSFKNSKEFQKKVRKDSCFVWVNDVHLNDVHLNDVYLNDVPPLTLNITHILGVLSLLAVLWPVRPQGNPAHPHVRRVHI